MLFIDQLRQNANAQVIIDATGTGGPYIKAFVMQDVTFGGRNTFNSALEAIMGGIAGINSAYKAGAAVGNRLMGQHIPSRTLSGGDSVMAWVASDRPRLTLPLLFLAINSDDDPRQIARDLMQFVYPNGNPNTILTAPLGYIADFFDSGAGCVAVKIGTWFATPRIFIVKSVEMTISQRTDPNGVPLYVGAIIEMESQRTMTIDEVQEFFVGDGLGAVVANTGLGAAAGAIFAGVAAAGAAVNTVASDLGLN